jgi:threonine dehydrogenase-like Zn-dependent dehydrogenase
MKAVIRRGRVLVVDDIVDLAPATGQVLVKTLACGICGSDLHALHHAEQLADIARRSGGGEMMDPAKDIVFGHEFCAEILEHGIGNTGVLKAGTRVVSVPVAMGATGMETIGYSNALPGGFAQNMVLTEAMLLPVPNGLSAPAAALTEPLAVGLHAANLASLDGAGVAVVIGCGPVGLAVIAALKARGFGPVLAADFSPARRASAEAIGADIVVDPAVASPYGRWNEFGVPATGGERGMVELMGGVAKNAVIFECVGVPGLLQAIIEGAPAHAQIVVVGVCMETDRFEPALAITKHLDLRFAYAYTPAEFAQSLYHLAEGIIKADNFITGTVDLAGTAGAFETLAKPAAHIKIIVEPNA